VRTLVVWCPDWPVIAAGIVDGCPVDRPVVVLYANRVLASSPAARAEGIRRGLRKREAQGRCPSLTVIEHDPGRDARPGPLLRRRGERRRAHRRARRPAL
jgi:protein ImuB